MTVTELEDVIAFLRTHRDVFYLLVLRREVGLRLLAVGAGQTEQMPRTSSERDDQDRPTATTPVPPTASRVAASSVAASRGEVPSRAQAVEFVHASALRRGPGPHHGNRRRDHLWSSLGQGPDVWLQATALMRALQRRAKTGAGAEP
ncbi:hypothetical protein [Terrabacter sp. C0L_2]|uniref:hypothetical protein n=1 Tax=Terrabacter sp. C0L_2 TaxID=3108389 RepID=UPI00185A4EA4|nr:hypothetical protein [Dermatophilaceae bacterium]WVM95403.1 hypothetical protein U5C87_15540 [Terrabacter sp. C0L_2]